ncbi:MAG: PAS domain S-box protein [Candidatus Obscuribacterales bacterium]|nr:PAS domain S-box protein [Candidatus Obscuribacterales bacterium]
MNGAHVLKLKVFHKGLILVGIPLLVELVLIASLSLLLNQADQEKAKEQTYRKYAALTARLMAMTSEAPYLLFMSIQFQNEKLYQSYERSINDIKAYSDEYEELVKAHKELTADTETLKKMISQLMDIAAEIGESRKTMSVMDLMNRIPEFRQRFEALKDVAVTKLAQMVQQGEEQTIEIQAKQANIRNMITVILTLGALFNIGVGIALSMFYKSSIMERIRTITKNTVALSKGQKLLPQIGGDDEIALLDKSFHHMHEQLVEASEREKALFNNASDVICVLDSNNRFSKVNPICFQYWGYKPEDLIGVSLTDLICEADLPTTEDLIINAKLSKTPVSFENRVKTKSGKTIEVLWSAYWSESELSLFCIVHDISERKQIERIKKQFLAMISSDLKTPLSSISASVSVLISELKDTMPKMAVDKLDMAKKNVLRLLGLVNDLLQITEMDTGNLEIRKENNNIEEVLRRSMQDVEAIADKQKVKLHLVSLPGDWYVDPNRIMQVLVNLLSNAIKFSPENGIVTLSAERQGDYVLCKVIDQGRGVPESHKSAIFEKFKQVEAADGKRKSGTGLGLPICKQIVEEHGGIIGVESSEGKGSTFWFRVPIDETVSMKIRAQTKAAQAAKLASKSRIDVPEKANTIESTLLTQVQRPKGGSKLKLAWKGVILIGIPIIFEMIFVGALSLVLIQVDHERATELHQRNIAFNASKLLNLYFKTGLSMAGDKSIRTWLNIDKCFREADQVKDELHKLVEHDQSSLEHLIKVEQAQEKLVRFAERGRRIMSSPYDGSSEALRVGTALDGRDKLLPVVIGVAHRIQKVVDDAEDKEFVSPNKQMQLRQRQGQILLAGLTANVLVSILLALFFTRDVTSRLTILADNADRLAKEKELNPLITGSDEIAQLDRVFHVTAMALAEARQKERAVFDNSQDFICALSHDGKFTSVNPACEKTFGYDKEEMLGKNVLDICHPEDLDSTRKTLLGDFGGQSHISFENRINKQDGSMIYVLWSASHSKEDNSIYCIAHDITSRKELEQLKQEFLAMVSHDLRTPLTSITGIAKLIGAGAFGTVAEEPMKVLNSINKNGDKLLELINDLLDIEKLESGHMKLVLEAIKIQELMEKSIATVPAGRQIKMEFFGENADLEFMADKDRLIQAVGNILSHAALRSPDSSTIKLMARYTESAVEMRIIDSAPALSEQARAQLFDRFKDMSSMKSASIEERVGTGLALPIARKIIESHGGSITVFAQTANENVFSISIPLSAATATKASTAQS